MKLHFAFAALLPVLSPQASALEATLTRAPLNNEQPKGKEQGTGPSNNPFDYDQDPMGIQENKEHYGPPAPKGSGPPEFAVEHVSFNGVPSKEELHGTGAQGGGPPGNIPAQVDMTARIDGMTVGSMAGAPSRHGKIETSDFGPDFSKVPVMVFKGLSEDDNHNKPLVLKRLDVNAPLPKVWKLVGNGDLIGEDAQVWYGEEVGQGAATGMFMANTDGNIVGSIQDGTNTYAIQTEYEEDIASDGNVNWRSTTNYSVVKMNNLPLEDDADEDGSDPGRRLLRSNLRKVGVDATRVSEKTRELQADCDDIEGFYGPWYDSDGPYYDCDWYSHSDYCSRYGNSYSNFGFTANQACCACGGGGVLVDILVAYSSGTHANMLNLVNLSIYQTNLALSMSGTNVRLRLVGLMKDSSFSDNGKSNKQILDELSTNGDGHLDFVHNWRDTYGADLVHYIGDNVPSGTAYTGETTEAHGFAVTRTSQAALAGTYTFAHEIGHNFGCLHDTRNDSTAGFNHGFFDSGTCTRTIMTYPNDCLRGRVLQYSNTVNTVNGEPIGDATTQNNARAITERAQTLKGYRSAKFSRTVELCKHSGCEGGSYQASHTVGDWNRMPAEIGNDQLSQVYIPRGLSFEYFLEEDFGGLHRTYGSLDDEVLLTMGGHDDSVSSFKVRQIPSGQVRLCRHSDCSGGYVSYLSVGTYTSMPSIIGDDALSFVEIPRGFKFEYFQYTNLEGWNRSFGSKDNTIRLSMRWVEDDDSVSSFIISVL